MSREKVELWREVNGKQRWSTNITRLAADNMQREGRGTYDPQNHWRIMEIPIHERLKASERGAIRGGSCSYSGGIPCNGIGHAPKVDGIVLEGAQLERNLTPLEVLATSPAKLSALAMHFATETAAGASLVLGSERLAARA